jgi:N-acetylglucosamine-6-phosphate deacetylase
MKTYIKYSTVIGLITAIFLLAGCGKAYVGTYVLDSSRHLELKSDGTFLLENDGTMTGTYKIEGQTVTLTMPTGVVSSGTIDGNTITMTEDGGKWTKK